MCRSMTTIGNGLRVRSTDGASQVPDVATGGAAFGSTSKPITEDYEQGASPKWSGAPSASAFRPNSLAFDKAASHRRCFREDLSEQRNT